MTHGEQRCLRMSTELRCPHGMGRTTGCAGPKNGSAENGGAPEDGAQQRAHRSKPGLRQHQVRPENEGS